MTTIGIIGGGPAGYSAAIRAKQYGFDVLLFEQSNIGGTCLNKGCIPTKSILHSCELFNSLKLLSKNGISAENISYDYARIKEKQVNTVEKIKKSLTKLILDNDVTLIHETAEILNGNTVKTATNEYKCDYIIVATGSKPNLFSFNGEYSPSLILTSDDILNIEELPERITIVGSGAIGIEWARIFSCLNKNVKIIELATKLIPSADYEISEKIERIFKRNKIEFYTNTTIDSINGNIVNLTNGKSFETGKILIAIGRTPVIPNFIGAVPEISKYIKVDNNFRTSIPNVFAAGDVNGISMLAHSATNQALQIVEYIKHKTTCDFEKDFIPAVIYTTPEIAFFGKTEQELISQNVKYKKSVFPYAALGKAQADDKIEGFIKVLSVDDKIKGGHIIGEEASALIQQLLIAAKNNTGVREVTKTVFSHPTYSEGVLEALEGLDGLAINIPKAQIK